MKVLQIVGFKNTGKTTLIQRMVALLKSKGKRVAVIKHHHLDKGVVDAGTDTGSFLEQGADFTILNTPNMSVRTENMQPSLEAQMMQLAGEVDVLLIEGYKREEYPKIVLTHSFTDGHTNVDKIGLRNVLKHADMRYDEGNIIQWFDEWSSDDETV